ncbi:MAG TPA: metallophosphoesterase [Acidimicrobiia bacterium]|nr:metallophosphoesterase [Acidimicrobiia bacterium]
MNTADRTRRRRRGQAGLLLAVALLVGACTSRSDGDAARNDVTTTSAAAPSTTVSPTTPSTSGTASTTGSTTSAPTSATTSPAGTPGTTTQSGIAAAMQPLEAAVAPPAFPGAPVAGFVAIGDFGGGPAQGAVAQAMVRWAATHRVDALVTTGDNVYDFGEPQLFDAHLTEPYRELRAGHRPMWVTLGNHDVVRGHGPAQLAYLGLPALPYAAGLPGVRFLILDGNRPDAEQAGWLDAMLARPDPRPAVVVFHGPVYSCSLHGPTPAIVANWQPVLEARRVPLVLAGHDHVYSRFLSPAGVNHVVTGGGGRELYARTPDCQPPELRAIEVVHHFVGVEVYPDRLVVTAVAADDRVVDRLEIPALASVPG